SEYNRHTSGIVPRFSLSDNRRVPQTNLFVWVLPWSAKLSRRAAQPQALLRLRTPAFHHLQLLSPAAAVGGAAPARSVFGRAGNHPQAVHLHSDRVRGDAGARTSAFGRARNPQHLGRNQGAEAKHCTARVARLEKANLADRNL